MSDPPVPFAPDWAIPPGETILDLLEDHGWSQVELACRLGYTPKHVNQLIKGKASLTQATAQQLALVLGPGAGFWLRYEALYREFLAREQAAARYSEWIPWLDKLPVRQLMKIGAIGKRRVDAGSKPGLVKECLQFFKVASPDEWRTHYLGMACDFRRSRVQSYDEGAVSAWLRLGERKAEQLDDRVYIQADFESALRDIRGLTLETPDVFEPKMRDLLGRAGVGFVLVPAIPRARISGAARWLGSQRPLIQLSLFGKTNDKFWFTFFHEAAHILLHGKNKKSVWLDDGRGGVDEQAETEADRWASDILIPPQYMSELSGLQTRTEVEKFARNIGVHPGIVVGRLQHERVIRYQQLNDLKVSYRFVDEDAA